MLNNQQQFQLHDSEGGAKRAPDLYRAIPIRPLATDIVNQEIFPDQDSLPIGVDDGDAEAWLARGKAMQAQNEVEQALACHDHILAIEPEHARAWYGRGIALHALGRADLALCAYARAIAARPELVDVYVDQARLLVDIGDLSAALDSVDAALTIAPGQADTHINRGALLLKLGRSGEALVAFDSAIALSPHSALAHNYRGSALRALGMHDEAVAAFQQALLHDPGLAEAHNNLGISMRADGRFEEAIAAFDRAISLQPDCVPQHVNRANTLRDLGQFAPARQAYQAALELSPQDPEIYFNLGICNLQQGNFQEGWEGYQWRLETPASGAGARQFPQPMWTGEQSLSGKTILLHSEQGLGDGIQFCRYAQMVAALGATVLLEVAPPLRGLLSTLVGPQQLITRGEALPAFDLHCPLLSVPFAMKTGFDNMPPSGPYLRADADLAARWQAELWPRHGPRIGIAWSGQAAHTNDLHRSMDLVKFAALLPQGLDAVCLQNGLRPGEEDVLSRLQDVRFFGTQIRDFADTAALCEQVDLVLCVDTSVAHLAGALGKPVWVILPFNPDWRWLLGREDSPWYASMRLYRRAREDGGAAMLAQLRADLLAWTQSMRIAAI